MLTKYIMNQALLMNSSSYSTHFISSFGLPPAPPEVLLRSCFEARRAGSSAPRHHDRHLQQEHQLCSHKGLSLFLYCPFKYVHLVSGSQSTIKGKICCCWLIILINHSHAACRWQNVTYIYLLEPILFSAVSYAVKTLLTSIVDF